MTNEVYIRYDFEKFKLWSIDGIQVIVDTVTLCINASLLCNFFGKNINHWLSMNSSVELLNRLGNQGFPFPHEIEVPFHLELGGVYVPRVVFPSLMSWIDLNFYFKICSVVPGLL